MTPVFSTRRRPPLMSGRRLYPRFFHHQNHPRRQTWLLSLRGQGVATTVTPTARAMSCAGGHHNPNPQRKELDR